MDRHRLLPGPPLVPAAVAVLCFAAVLALGIPVAGERGASADSVDTALTLTTNRLFDALPGVAVPLSYSTYPAAMAALIVVLAVIGLRLHRPRVAALAVAGPAVTVALNTWVLKPLFDRTHEDWLAYPSGHTATLVSVLAVIAVVAAGSAPEGNRARVALLFGVGGLVLTAVAVSAIVERDYHYPSDTLGAWFWAIGTVVTIAALIDRLPWTVRPVGDRLSGTGRSGNATE